MLEIGFGHKIPKLNFVSHLKISQENRKKNFYDQTYQKKWKNLNFLLNGQYLLLEFSHFLLLFDGIICQNDFILKGSELIFQWKTKFSLGILWSKSYFKYFV